MEKKKRNKYLKTVLKALITSAAIWIVAQKIDLDKTLESLSSANLWWLFVAAFLYLVSKIISSFRLNLYFKDISLDIGERYNLRLYLIGMFYNLFLPGGIGGDGYKIYLLNNRFKTPVKQLIGATLIDRISGLMALVLLFLIFLLLIPLEDILGDFAILSPIALLILMPTYYLFYRIFFKAFLKSIIKTSLLALLVQVFQVLCAWVVLMALGVNDKFIEYQVLFLVSSVVAVLPLTIGGVGARELTFVLGYEYLGVDKNVAVAFSLLFFLITAFVSLIGAFIRLPEEDSCL